MVKARRTTVELASASFLVALALGFASGETTSALIGDWSGTLDSGEGAAKLKLVLHLGKNPDGTLKGSIDSVDEKVNGIPIDKAIFADGKLDLEISTIGAHCETTLAPNRTEMKGRWHKKDVSFPVEFKKGAAPAAEKRPGS